MTDPIPGEWLSAATLAVESQPTGTPAAQVARVVLEAVAPLVRASAMEGAETQWGVTRPAGGSGSDEVNNCGIGGEAFARQLLGEHRRIYGNAGGLSTRQITPWKKVPDA